MDMKSMVKSFIHTTTAKRKTESDSYTNPNFYILLK